MPIIGLVPVMEEQQSPQSRRHRHFSEISSSSSLTPPFKHLGLSCSPPTMSEAVAVQDPPLDLTPDEANRIIHSHRKVRYGTACWPCRQRKVKCDNKQPCENCVKRDHANLCSYNPKQNPSKSKDPPGSVAGVKRARSPASDESVKKEEDRWPRTTDEEDPNESRYLGQNSIAAFLSEEAQAGESLSDDEQDVIRKDIMPILGLQISSASYPFMSREHMDKIRLEIAAALPSDRDVLKTFQIYKQIVQPFWGLLVDIEDFESKLCIYLEDRSASSKHPANSGKGVSSAWLGMLFAVLAVANNYSEQAYHKRVAASQTFVHCSFHCLRLSNYLIRPSLESIQALIILGFVLSNDMKAEASWALMGLTCRLAQALGLHRAPHEGAHASIPAGSDLPRRKLWWTILWQDSLLSLSFDRSPIAVMTRCQSPLSETALTIGFSYTEAMYTLCYNILQSVKNDSNSSPTFDQIIANSIEVENIRQQVVPRLRSLDLCKTLQDRLQHFAVRLHTSFVVSVFCRPALRRGETPGMDATQKAILADKCKANLTETVRMYLKMHSLSVIPTRSWAFTYHGLSSAVLLGILGETKTDLEVRQLQGDLISALSVTAAKEQTTADVPKSDRDIELSGPLSRALVALQNIYDHGWVIESKAKAAQGTQVVEQDLLPFEQQDAAIAMASMQNGVLPPLDYSQQMGQVNMSDAQSLDQTMHMSPMDLFDSIFWEYPTTGLDQMGGFDYTQQLYPQF
ncbi:probable ZFR1 regulator of fumonisin biosynthesis [Rhynchosporium secalis]|uniref:Probable ZFR1 regulator of fumonisin biosynthesis n=1 Tax=Rhynchosporium secalis TaxID=38038 RepID=A0A1E1MIA6_RHYSE|nr:probable ZFR1 regulator of fumonisin biosynthesis [Rhynchosporium secalis]